jgi:hypothetical protein
MRKRLKKKLRSCQMCKPWKMGHENRWKVSELGKLEDAEKEIRKNKGIITKEDSNGE